jgi:hypothetical protein
MNELDEITLNKIHLEKIMVRWIEDYDALLEALLIELCFDFTDAEKLFNKIAGEIITKTGKEYNNFTEEELRLMWTYIEVNKNRVASK